MAVVTMKGLLEAGVHFGHAPNKWNPKMKKYIYGTRNNVHVINLELTVDYVERAYAFIRDIAKEGKDILFVGTKKQAQDAIKDEAVRCGMYYINERWLGGTLTNLDTIKKSIDKLNSLNQKEAIGELDAQYTKKEAAMMRKERDKLETAIGGIKNMPGLPGALVVVDIQKEKIAVLEAKKLGIPVVALVDTCCDPDLVDYVIPGNDDAIRAVKLILSILAYAVIEGRDGIPYEVVEENEEEYVDSVATEESVSEEVTE